MSATDSDRPTFVGNEQRVLEIAMTMAVVLSDHLLGYYAEGDCRMLTLATDTARALTETLERIETQTGVVR